MPNYELHYFSLSGRAGVARLLFALADKPFTDTIIQFGEWNTAKKNRKTFPFCKAPVLVVDGTPIAESLTINEFLANEFDLHGNSNLDRARVSMISHAAADMWTLWTKFAFEKDQEVASKLKDKFYKEQLPDSLVCLEDILKERNGGDQYFLGEKMSLADIAYLDFIITMLPTDGTILEKTPKLASLHKRLVAIPTLAKHIPTRKTTF